MDIRIEIINKALKNETMESPDNDTLKELARVFHENSMLPYLYKVFRIEGLKSTYFKASLLSANNDNYCKEITNLFNEHGIKHIYFKGQVIKKLYDDKALRLMGDVDIIVEEKKYSEAIKLLEANGYIKEDEAEHHAELKKKNFEVEIHRLMMPTDVKWYNFFSKPFENAHLVDKAQYALDDTYHFLFVVIHYLKHVIWNGAGIRPFVDMYLMLTKLDIDNKKLNEGIAKLKLEKVWNTILNMLYKLFDFQKYPFEKQDFIDKFFEYTVNCGIHGYGEKNVQVLGNPKGKKKTKIGYLFSKCFAPYSSMKKLYPFTKCVLLLPLGYIVRFFDLLINRRKKLMRVVNSSNEKNSSLSELMEMAGIVE